MLRLEDALTVSLGMDSGSRRAVLSRVSRQTIRAEDLVQAVGSAPVGWH
jgi:hypothetical protein